MAHEVELRVDRVDGPNPEDRPDVDGEVGTGAQPGQDDIMRILVVQDRGGTWVTASGYAVRAASGVGTSNPAFGGRERALRSELAR